MLFRHKKFMNFLMIIIIGIMILPIFTYVDAVKSEELANRDILKVKGKINNNNNEEENEEIQAIESAVDKVKESFVFGEILKNSPYYNNYSSTKKKIGIFKKGQIVEIIRDRSYQWYLVKSEDGKRGWVSKNSLLIPKNPETNEEQMTKDEIEEFVNRKGFESDTAYLVWVDIDRQLTHVFLGKKGNWRLFRTMLSSTGENISPTIKGIFKIQDRGKWFYTERLKSGGKYWVRFDGAYLFHSVAMDRKGNIVDDTLGKRASAGCIRLSLEDSQWFYKYVRRNSTVFIN